MLFLCVILHTMYIYLEDFIIIKKKLYNIHTLEIKDIGGTHQGWDNRMAAILLISC